MAHWTQRFDELEALTQMRPFHTKTYGKWILVGEHAVLRGYPALAFPLIARSLELNFEPDDAVFDVQFRGPHGAEFKLLFYGVIENALHHLKRSEPLKGRFVVTSSLPVGAGLGASAALCGAVARWCESQGWIDKQEVYEFARQLEDLFHGESSGVDLAVSLAAQGVRFVRGGELRPLQMEWSPRLFLSYCGQRGMTSECVLKVKRMFETDAVRAEALDRQMESAVRHAEAALPATEETSFLELKEALRLGRDCFEQWGLCGGDMGAHLRELEAAGAVAAKPTGSGGGGYALSLWSHEPPSHLTPVLVPVSVAPTVL